MSAKYRSGRMTIEVADSEGELAKLLDQAREKFSNLRISEALLAQREKLGLPASMTLSEAEAIGRCVASSIGIDVRVAKNTELLRHLLTCYLAGSVRNESQKDIHDTGSS